MLSQLLINCANANKITTRKSLPLGKSIQKGHGPVVRQARIISEAAYFFFRQKNSRGTPGAPLLINAVSNDLGTGRIASLINCLAIRCACSSGSSQMSGHTYAPPTHRSNTPEALPSAGGTPGIHSTPHAWDTPHRYSCTSPYSASDFCNLPYKKLLFIYGVAGDTRLGPVIIRQA